MNRAQRRRAAREAEKAAQASGPPEQMIRLENPVTHHFETFIVGNSQFCDEVIQPDSRTGQHVVICGAGPSLRDHVQLCEDADEVWGCNSAAPWLYDEGCRVTHALTVDQTPAMVNEWASLPPLGYMVASTVHPHLTDLLVESGHRLTWFHNFVGIRKPPVEFCECGHDEEPDHETGVCSQCECEDYRPRRMAYEDWLYLTLYEPTVRAGSGLNTVTRAIDVALFMGCRRVTVLGADCAIRVREPLPEGVQPGTKAHERWLQAHTEMHANGDNALASGATPVTLTGEIDGREWLTKPDMAISAVFLMRMKQKLGDRLDLVGDTLPNAIMDKPDEFIDRLPSLIDHEGRTLRVG